MLISVSPRSFLRVYPPAARSLTPAWPTASRSKLSGSRQALQPTGTTLDWALPRSQPKTLYDFDCHTKTAIRDVDGLGYRRALSGRNVLPLWLARRKRSALSEQHSSGKPELARSAQNYRSKGSGRPDQWPLSPVSGSDRRRPKCSAVAFFGPQWRSSE